MIYFQVGCPICSMVIDITRTLTSIFSVISHRFPFLGKWWFFLVCFQFFPGIIHAFEEKWDRILLLQGYHQSHFESFPFRNQEEKRMIEALKERSLLSFNQEIIRLEDSFFAINYCNMDLYKWSGVAWGKMSSPSVTGYNCTPYFFVKDQSPHLIPGEGYWENKMDLFAYRPSGGFEFLKTKNQPANFSGKLYFSTAEGVFSFFGSDFNARLNLFEQHFGNYFLDVKSNSWKEVAIQWNRVAKEVLGSPISSEEHIFRGYVETRDFGIIELYRPNLKKEYWLIFDKNLKQIYLKEMPHLIVSNSKWLKVTGNSLEVLKMNSITPVTIRVSEEINSSVLVGNYLLKDELGFFRAENLYWGIPVLFLIFGWVIKRMRHQKKSPSASVQNQEAAISYQIDNWLENLFPYSGKLMSQEDLDEVFQIHELKNPDLRKVRRSRAIKALNEYMIERQGKPVIQRVRDEQDMRIIRYLIENFALTKSTKTTKPRIK